MTLPKREDPEQRCSGSFSFPENLGLIHENRFLISENLARISQDRALIGEYLREPLLILQDLSLVPEDRLLVAECRLCHRYSGQRVSV